MDVQEYKGLKERLTFPSGLILDITPPSVMELIEASHKDGSNMLDLLSVVAKGFPDGFTLNDIRKPEDFKYLVDFTNHFFDAMHEPAS